MTRRRLPKHVALVAMALIGALIGGHAHAQLTWSAAANTTWDTSSANWAPGPAAWTANSNAVFDATASLGNRAITVSGTQSVGTLTVSNAGYSFTGGALQYTQGTSGTWTFNQPTTINSGMTSTLSGTNRAFITTGATSTGPLTITGPISMQGTGTTWLRLTGRSTLSGNTVSLNNVGLDLWGNGSGGQRIENSTVLITSSNSGNNGGIILVSGSLTVVSSTITTTNMLAANGASATLNMTSGLLTIGTLTFHPASGSNAGVLNLDGGTIELNQLVRSSGSATTSVTLNFNGGTLRARQNQSTFISYGTGISTSRVLAGGARFDTNGFNITVGVPLTSGTANDGGLVKLSTGTLTLSASNSYVGTTAINGGTLLLQNADALAGGGSVTFGGGSLQYSGSNTADYSARIVSSGSAILIDTNGQSVSFASSIGSSNTGGLTKLGSGTLSLSGSNGYSGATTVSAGVLRATTSASALGAGTLALSGGSLQLASDAGLSFGRDTIVSTSGTIVSGRLTGGAGVTQTLGTLSIGGQTLTLDKDASVTSGIAGLTFGNVSQTGAATFAANAGTLLTTGTVSGDFNLAVGGAGDTTIAGFVTTGAQTLTKNGAGTLTLSATSSHAGLTTITGGTLAYGVANALGTGGVAINGGVLNLGGFNDSVGAVTLTSGNIIGSGTLTSTADYTLTSGTVSAPLAGSVGLAKSGVGTVVLSAANAYTGTTSIQQGTLQLGDGTTDGSIASTAGVINSGTFAINNRSNRTIGTSVSGNGVVNFSGASATTLVLTSSNTYTGNTSVSGSGFTLQIGDGTTDGSIASSGTISIGTNATLDFRVAGNQTIASTLPAAGGTLTKSGSGMLTIAGTNSANTTRVNAGILRIQNSDGVGASTILSNNSSEIQLAGNIAIPINKNFTLSNNGSGSFVALRNVSGSNSIAGAIGVGAGGGGLAMQSDSGLLTISGTITATSATRSFVLQGAANGVIAGGIIDSAGSSTLTKSGNGTWTLSGASTTTGLTTISGGTLAYGVANALGTGGVTINGGVLDLGGFSDSVGAVTLTSGNIIGSGTLTSTADYTLTSGTVSAPLAGSVGLAKSGAGTAVLSAANAYTGTTTITGGTLAAGGNALAGGGNLTFSGGALQYLAGNTSDYGARIKSSGSAISIDTNGHNVTYSGAIDASNTAGLTKSGLGTLTLAAANTYTGTTTVNAGTLAIGAGGRIGATGIVKVSAGTLDLAGNNLTIRGLFNDVGQTSAVVTNSGTGTVILTATTPAGVNESYTYYGTLTDGTGGGKLGLSVGQSNGFGGSAISFTLGSGGSATYSGPTIIGTGNGSTSVSGLINPNSAYTVNGGAFFSVAGVTGTIGSLAGDYGNVANYSATAATLSIGALGTDTSFGGKFIAGSGTLAVTKVGSGRLTLTGLAGASDFTGLTTVSQGVLNIRNASSLGATSAGTTVASGAALEIQGGITVGAEALNLAGTGVGGAGALRNVSGTNTYGGAITLGSAARINSDLGRLTLSAALGGAGQNLTIGGAGDVTISGGIATGSGSLTKDGAGTLLLSGSNSHSGGTVVQAGTFVVNGSLGAGPVSVAAAAALMGSGTIGGAVSILDGGILAPGNSPGTLTVNDAFTLADTSILNFEFNAQDTTVGGGINDLITGVTNLTLDGVLNLSGSGDWTNVANNSSWRLFNYTGTLTDNGLTIGTQPTLGAGQTLQISTATAGQVNLVIVPEPTGLVLIAAGIAGAAWIRRRRA